MLLPAPDPNIIPEPQRRKSWRACRVCKRHVIDGVIADGAAIVVEWCPEGRGDLGLTSSLFPGEPPVAQPSKGTKFRRHRCLQASEPPKSFSGALTTAERKRWSR